MQNGKHFSSGTPVIFKQYISKYQNLKGFPRLAHTGFVKLLTCMLEVKNGQTQSLSLP